MALQDITNAHRTQTELRLKEPKVLHTFADFQLIQRLGSGTFGLVYKSLNRNREKVALKIVQLEQFSSSADTLEPILCEVGCWRAALGGKNIAQLYECRRVGSVFYFSMEMAACDVLSLSSYLARRDEIMSDDVLRSLSKQALCGILHLHSVGVMHRDIKPENMLLSFGGRLMHSDFGWSKKVAIGMKTRTRGGTAQYLAPEIINRSEYDHSIDLWALGICILEWVSGKNYINEALECAGCTSYSEKVEYMKQHPDLFIKMISEFPSNGPRGVRVLLKNLLKLSPIGRLGASQCPAKKYEQTCTLLFFKGAADRIPVRLVQDVYKSKSAPKPSQIKKDLDKLKLWQSMSLESSYDDLFKDFEWSGPGLEKPLHTPTRKRPLKELQGSAAAAKLPRLTLRV